MYRKFPLVVIAGFFVLGVGIASCISGRHKVIDVSLANTYWRLTQLGERQVTGADWQQEPHLIFGPDLTQVSGSAGCNQLSGGTTVKPPAMTFGDLAMTRMACAKGMELERDMAAALGQVHSYRLDGDKLELLGENGAVVARFVAVSPST